MKKDSASSLLKATILTLLRAEDGPRPAGWLKAHPMVLDLKVAPSRVDSTLNVLYNQKLVGHDETTYYPDYPNAKVGFFILDADGIPVYSEGKPEEAKVKRQYKRKPAPSTDGQELKIDVVKSTGRLRIQYKGLHLEIGIVED